MFREMIVQLASLKQWPAQSAARPVGADPMKRSMSRGRRSMQYPGLAAQALYRARMGPESA